MRIRTTNYLKKNNFKTNDENLKTKQEFLFQYELSNTISVHSNKSSLDNSGEDTNRTFETIDEDNNGDFLLLLWKKFDDIFKKLEGHEKIFEELKKKYKIKKFPPNKTIKGPIQLKKVKPPKKIYKKPPKIDSEKIVEIQKIFKGYFLRSVSSCVDRLKLRQCLLELFCLLLVGHWGKAQVRYYFRSLKKFYIACALFPADELGFIDKINFKLPGCFYSGTKINYLNSPKIGEDIIDE